MSLADVHWQSATRVGMSLMQPRSYVGRGLVQSSRAKLSSHRPKFTCCNSIFMKCSEWLEFEVCVLIVFYAHCQGVSMDSDQLLVTDGPVEFEKWPVQAYQL